MSQQYRLAQVALSKSLSRRVHYIKMSEEDANGVADWVAYFGNIGTRFTQKFRCTDAEMQDRVRRKQEQEDAYTLLYHVEEERVELPKIDLHPKVYDLMTIVMSTAYDEMASKLSVDPSMISMHAVGQAHQVLETYKQSTDDEERRKLMKAYYTLIPTNLPQARNYAERMQVFKVNDEFERLKQLETILATAKSLSAEDMIGTQYQLLGAHIGFVPETEPIYEELKRMVKSRNYELDEVFQVFIPGEREAFERFIAQTGMATKLLYHGTRTHNMQHILRTGLLILPEARNGSRFGRGLYFADNFDKSVNYTDEHRFVFVADVAVGNQFKDGGLTHYTQPPQGYDSVWGTNSYGGMDEFVVYGTERQTLRYIVRTKRKELES